MTDTEFIRWLDNHQTLQPSVRAWLDGQPDKSLLLDEWAAVLRNVSMSSCKAATSAILSGELDRPFPEDVPKAVLAWARELDYEQRKATTAAEPHNPLVCQLCRNNGLVECWNTMLVRAVREDCTAFIDHRTGRVSRVFRSDGQPKYETGHVACKCAAGTNYRTTKKRGRAEVANPVFGDSPLHVAVVSSDYRADIAAALPENYSQELADF